MARDSRGRFTFDVDKLSPGLREFFPKIREAAARAFDFHESQAESYMRQNAPWQDQTGNARNGLRAKHVRNELSDALVLYHTMPYGVWLEVRHSGRYAIIVPTMRRQGVEIVRTLDQLLAAIRGGG